MLIQIERGKVALISGGGSGHEPFCAGYIGQLYYNYIGQLYYNYIGQTTFDKLAIQKHQAKAYKSSSIFMTDLGF